MCMKKGKSDEIIWKLYLHILHIQTRRHYHTIMYLDCIYGKAKVMRDTFSQQTYKHTHNKIEQNRQDFSCVSTYTTICTMLLSPGKLYTPVCIYVLI